MTLEEGIVAFATTGIGSLLIGSWLTRKRDKFESYIKEQSFYKELINDLKKERASDSKEIEVLTAEIHGLRDQIQSLIKDDSKKKKTIKQQEQTILKWENYAEQLKGTITELLNELEKEKDDG